MKQYDLLLVNPPSLIKKPDVGYGGGIISHTELSDKIKVSAMNPGILSIASNTLQKGYSVNILDLSNDSDLKRLENRLETEKYKLIGISSTSGFDYIEALDCIKISKEKNPDSITIIGGQHAGPLGEKVLRDANLLDIVCLYEGEKVVLDILSNKSFNIINGIAFKEDKIIKTNKNYPIPIKLDDLAPFNFSIYPKHKNFAPFVEESRGCYAKCDYCTSNHVNNGKIRIKSVEKIIEQLDSAISIWGKDQLYILSAATFGVNEKHMLTLAEEIKNLNINWTTEFRADLPWYNHIDKLYKSGLKVAIVGMESASPEILLKMNKTKDPQKYIKSMENAINACKKIEDLTLRLNLMMYVGETPKTMSETLSFIGKNIEGIDAILYTPIFINPGTSLSRNFRKFENEEGAKIIKSDYWDKRHLHLCHPSKYFSFQEALSFCDIMEKIVSKEKGWIESERFHYTGEGLTDKKILESRFIRREN